MVQSEHTTLIYNCPNKILLNDTYESHYSFDLRFDDDTEEFFIAQEEWIFYPYLIMRLASNVDWGHKTTFFIAEDWDNPGYRWHMNLTPEEFAEAFPNFNPKEFDLIKPKLEVFSTFA